MRFAAHVQDNGPPWIFIPESVTGWCRKRKGQQIEVELRDQTAIRSNRANAFWWAVVVPLVAEQWERERGTLIPRQFVHDALVQAFGGEWADTPLGRARRSTSNMTVEEFSGLIEATASYLLDKYGCVLPDPQEWSE